MYQHIEKCGRSQTTFYCHSQSQTSSSPPSTVYHHSYSCETGSTQTFLVGKSLVNCIYRVWIYGSTYCKINNFVSYLSVSASVFTLLAISNDRRKVTKSLSLIIMLYYSQNLLSIKQRS